MRVFKKEYLQEYTSVDTRVALVFKPHKLTVRMKFDVNYSKSVYPKALCNKQAYNLCRSFSKAGIIIVKMYYIQ